MKRVMALILALAALAGLAACGTAAPSSSAPAPAPSQPQSAPPASSAPEPAQPVAVDDGSPLTPDGTLAGLFTAFAGNTSGSVLNAEDNSCYSPASLYLALALASAGAEGETLDQLLTLLGADSAEALHGQMAQAMAALPFDGYTEALAAYEKGWLDLPAGLSNEEVKAALPEAGSRLSIGNSAWLNSLLYHGGYAPAFEAVALRDYQARLTAAPFGDAATDQALNGWIRENTGGLINPGVETDPELAMYLVNTVYVLDRWSSVFDPAQNTTEPFHLAGGASQDREYMNKTVSNHSYYRGEGFTAASLSMDHGSMTFILPDEGVSPAQLMATPQSTAALLAPEETLPAEVIFQVPKFKFESTLEPMDALKALGCTLPFDDVLSQLTGLVPQSSAGESLYISDILQQTYIRVDEEGAEAAAMTMVEMAPTAAIMEPPPTIELRLTRPFIFVLSRTLLVDGDEYHGEAPLFVGVVNDPVFE